MSFEQKDISYFKAFKAVVLKGKFETQGEALAQVGALFQWFNSLEAKIENSMKQPESKPKIKRLK